MSFFANHRVILCSYGLLISAILLMSGCQSLPGTAQQSTSKNSSLNGPYNLSQVSGKARIDQLSDRERTELYHSILAAELAAGNQENATALTHYLFALSIAPDSKIAGEAIALAQKENDPDALIQASEAWLEIAPNTPRAIEANILGHLIQASDSDALRITSLESAYKMTNRFINSTTDLKQLYLELSGINRLFLRNVTIALWQELVRNQIQPTLSWSLLAHAQFLAGSMLNNEPLKQRAENSVNAALRRDPTFTPAISLKVQILRATDREQLAIEFLNSLLLENAENIGAYATLAQYYYRNGEFDRGAKLVKQWLSLDPQNLEARYFLAANYYGQRNFEGALNEFRTLITANFKPETSLYYCGDTAERIEQYNQAITCYKQVKSGKYWYQAKRQLSFLLAYQRQEDTALADLENLAINASQERAEQAIVIRTDLLIYLDREADAIEWVSRFINNKLQSLVVLQKYLELTFLQSLDESWSDTQWFTWVKTTELKLKESLNIDWFLQSSDFFTRQQKPQLAVDILNHALLQYPDDIDLLYTRALLRETLNQPKLLESELRYVHQLQPNNPHILNALGYTLADQNKQLDYALELVEKAHKVLPQSAAVLDSLGWVYYRRGELEQAERWLRMSTEKEKAPETGAHLIEVLIQQKKIDQAKQLLQDYLDIFKNHPVLLKLRSNLNSSLEP